MDDYQIKHLDMDIGQPYRATNNLLDSFEQCGVVLLTVYHYTSHATNSSLTRPIDHHIQYTLS